VKDLDAASRSDEHETPDPSASVIITTYQTPPELLLASVQSVLEQTEPSIELVLVVDGAASEGDRKIIDRIQHDHRVKVLEPGRVGRGRALNLGIAAATAPIVAIQDADDESHHERVVRQLRVLDARPDIDLLATVIRSTRQADEQASWSLPAPTDQVRTVGDELLVRNVVAHSSVMVRRSALEAVSGYSVDRTRHYDYDLYLRIRQAGGTIAILDEPLVLRRLHDGQAFERESAISHRVWATYKLQMAHAAAQPLPRRVSSWAVITARQSGHLVRVVIRRRTAASRSD